MVIQLTLEFTFQTLAAYPGILLLRSTTFVLNFAGINSCEAKGKSPLAEQKNETDHLASDIADGIFPYLALLHAEIARFTRAITSKMQSLASSL